MITLGPPENKTKMSKSSFLRPSLVCCDSWWKSYLIYNSKLEFSRLRHAFDLKVCAAKIFTSLPAVELLWRRLSTIGHDSVFDARSALAKIHKNNSQKCGRSTDFWNVSKKEFACCFCSRLVLVWRVRRASNNGSAGWGSVPMQKERNVVAKVKIKEEGLLQLHMFT